MKPFSDRSLAGVQRQMHHLVFGKKDISERLHPRLALYRRLTRVPLYAIANDTFIFTRMIFEERNQLRFWQSELDRFISAHPPKDPRLVFSFKNFAEFLRAPAWIKELVDYEWVRSEVHWTPDPQRRDRINPSLVLRVYRYPVASWYRVTEELPMDAPLPKAPSKKGIFPLAIFRDPKSDRERVLELQPVVFELLMNWQRGGSPKSSTRALARQLKQPVSKLEAQIQPIVQMLIQERILNPAADSTLR